MFMTHFPCSFHRTISQWRFWTTPWLRRRPRWHSAMPDIPGTSHHGNTSTASRATVTLSLRLLLSSLTEKLPSLSRGKLGRAMEDSLSHKPQESGSSLIPKLNNNAVQLLYKNKHNYGTEIIHATEQTQTQLK